MLILCMRVTGCSCFGLELDIVIGWFFFGGSIHTVKENAEALVAAAREIGLEVSADKTEYMVMSRDQNAGRIHSVRMDNSTFERVEEFK